MAGDADDIVVTIEGEELAGEQETTVVVEGAGDTAKSKTQPDDPVEALKAQLAEKEAENARLASAKTAAESTAGQAIQRAQTAEREVTQARTEVAASTKATIESGIAAAKAEADAAQEAFESAFEAGDKKALSTAQRRIARAEADMAYLENAKAELPTQEVRKQRTDEPQRPAAQLDQTEQWVTSLSPRSQQWMRGHMEYATDAKKNARVVAAHHNAVADGIAPDSDEYFASLEKYLGLSRNVQQEQPTKVTNGSGTTQRRPSAPTAPVTPSGGGVSGGANTVTLTRGEADAATDGVTHIWNYDDPTGKGRWKKGEAIGIKEMARRKQALIKEGRYLNANVDGS